MCFQFASSLQKTKDFFSISVLFNKIIFNERILRNNIERGATGRFKSLKLCNIEIYNFNFKCDVILLLTPQPQCSLKSSIRGEDNAHFVIARAIDLASNCSQLRSLCHMKVSNSSKDATISPERASFVSALPSGIAAVYKAEKKL